MSRTVHLDRVLDCLEEMKVRATYGAVGPVVGLPPRCVGPVIGMLNNGGGRSPRGSWVVSKANKLPTGYTEEQLAPGLRSTKVITTQEQLRQLLSEWKTQEPPGAQSN